MLERFKYNYNINKFTTPKYSLVSLGRKKLLKMESALYQDVPMFEFNTGCRTLRYFIMKYKQTKRILFYGPDVMKGTVSATNLARKHFSLSSLGYCSKVTFPKQMFGIRNCSEGYFYDMKGVMHVAFNFYGFNEQIAIVNNLYNEWCLVGEDVLPQAIEIDKEDIVLEPFEFIAISHHTKCQECSLPQQPEETPIDKQNSVLHTPSPSHSFEGAEQNITETQVDLCNLSNSKYCQTDMKEKQNVDEKHYKNSKKHKHDFTKLSDHHQTCLELLESLSSVLRDYYNHYMDDIFFYKVYNLIEAFLFLLLDELETVIATTTGIFPFHLLLEVANLKKHSTKVTNEDYQTCVLTIYSKWFGMQFCNYRSAISNQISDFKKSLLLNNQFLPPAVEVLNKEIFPKFMLDFLSCWLNKRHEDEEFQSSKILLVLELLSDELLTGVGHVVYAKLKNTKAM